MTAPASVHYLDHAATTPMRQVAIAAYTETLSIAGNASSLHGSGRLARRRVEESREHIAELVGSRPSDVVFTSGGTEADNLAVLGQARARPGTALAVGATEHHSVLDAAAHLENHEHMQVHVLPVDSRGAVVLDAVAYCVEREGDNLALAAVMMVNNEIGTISDIPAIADIARSAGAAIHTDAIQAVGHVPVNFGALGVSSMSLSAHKFGGPMGVGALILDRTSPCHPTSFGGGQERDLRSGSVDVPGVVAMAAALHDAVAEMETESARLANLRTRLIEGVTAQVPDAVVNGGGSGHLSHPGIVNITFPGCSGESLILLLDAAGVECSTGSACTAGVAEPSHVVMALGKSETDARSCLRFSLGKTTTDADIAVAVEAIGPAVERAQMANTTLGGLRAGR